MFRTRWPGEHSSCCKTGPGMKGLDHLMSCAGGATTGSARIGRRHGCGTDGITVIASVAAEAEHQRDGDGTAWKDLRRCTYGHSTAPMHSLPSLTLEAPKTSCVGWEGGVHGGHDPAIGGEAAASRLLVKGGVRVLRHLRRCSGRERLWAVHQLPRLGPGPLPRPGAAGGGSALGRRVSVVRWAWLQPGEVDDN